MTSKRAALKDRLLEASLEHVPFDGWSARAIAAAARDIDMEPGTVRRLCPGGADDMLWWLEDWADRRMLALAEQEDLAQLRMNERIAALVRMRLEAVSPYREAVRRAIAARMLPQNAWRAAQTVWQTVDRIWKAAGDTAGREQGMSYYTKRSLLAGVLASTGLYWLDDESPHCRQSWAFLKRRIDDVMQIGRARAQIEGLIPGLGGARR